MPMVPVTMGIATMNATSTYTTWISGWQASAAQRSPLSKT